MERLSLIDVSSEDDLLISSSAERHRDLRASGLLENHGHNCFVLEPADAPKEENLVKMSKQWGPIPEMAESPEQKRAKSGKVNLWKSLAWDTAFFTSEGVLDTEELAIVNSTFGKTELCSLPGIQEELQKSTESTSTLDSESYKLENLEGDLFENIRASIQKSLGNRDHCQRGEPDALQLDLRKKVELCPQTKMKPPVALKAIGVSRTQFESTSKGAVGVKEAAKGTGDTKLLLKPPRIVPKPTSLPTVPSNKDSSGSVIKNNSRRTSSGNGANRHGTVAFSKTNGDSNRSISLLKANPTDISTVSAEQPRIRKEISVNFLPSRTIARASVVTPVSSDRSNEDHIRSFINSNTGAKSFKPSGLRMPSAKIGYFGAEKTTAAS